MIRYADGACTARHLTYAHISTSHAAVRCTPQYKATDLVFKGPGKFEVSGGDTMLTQLG